MSDSYGFRPQTLSDPRSAGSASAREGLTREDHREIRSFLALSTVRGIGQKTLFTFAEAGRSFGEVIEFGPDDSASQAGLARAEPAISERGWSEIRRRAFERGDELASSLDRLGVTLILRGHPDFPDRLRDLVRPPHWLFVQGSVDLLKQRSLSIVGTRKPSTDGLFLTRYVGACLCDWAAPTVSGLAAGIDQLVHEHSLQAGVPTIAVLGTGIFEDYPKGSAFLREQILADNGAIVTEYLPRISYSAENFVQRNRIQAALGRILIPVEWTRRSGTAHTVRFATQLRRPIGCLRLSQWPADRVLVEPGLGQETGEIFTVPRDQSRFDRFVRNALNEKDKVAADQLSLFDQE